MFDCPPSPPEARCEPEHAWPDDGLRWVADPRRGAPGLDSVLTWAFQEKASRIAFQTGHPVWVSIHGRNYRVTRGAVDEYELRQIVNHLYGPHGMARLQGGHDFDTAYALPPAAPRAAGRRKHRASADFRFAAVARGAARRARHP